MIRLEHLNLVVKNMEDTLAFYRAAFPHWEVRGGGQSNWYGVDRNWCHFGDEYNYLTFNDNGQGENREIEGHQVGVSHFAFETHNLKELEQRLNDAGFKRAKDGAYSPFRKNLYFFDPNGFEVEFVEYSSDLPTQRNIYEE
jgi:catechol 2,3-dioxygenase-like lactoylglutathione lyase family enzyme